MQYPPVTEVMTSNLVTINIEEPVSKIAQVFKEKNFHHIPIVDDDFSLKGIISLSDFERIKSGATLFRNPKKEEYDQVIFRSLRVSSIMTKDVIELQSTDDIQQAYRIFRENKFRALPVVDKGKLIGIVTLIDLLNYFFK